MYCYENVLKTTKIEVVAGVLEVTVCSDVDFDNLKKFNLIVCQSIPCSGLGLPVKIVSGTTKIDLMDRIGNYVIGVQLKPRCRYSMVYGANPVHLYTLIPPVACAVETTDAQ